MYGQLAGMFAGTFANTGADWWQGVVNNSVQVGTDLGWFFNISFWQTGVIFGLIILAIIPIVWLLKKDYWTKSLLAGLGGGLVVGASVLGIYLTQQWSMDGSQLLINAEQLQHGEIWILGSNDWKEGATSTWALIDWETYIDTGLGGYNHFIVVNDVTGMDQISGLITISKDGAITGAGTAADISLTTSFFYSWSGEAQNFFGVITGIFIAGLSFMVVPMIMTTLLLVMIKGGSSKRDSKILASSVGVSMVGVAMAILVAIALIPLINLAADKLPDGLDGERTAAEANNIWGMVRGWVPNSISGILSGGRVIISVMIVTIFLGFIFQALKRSGRTDITNPVQNFLEKSKDVIALSVDWILTLIPLVILTALPKFFIGNAVDNFVSLGLYLAAIYLGSLIVVFLHSLIAIAINRPKGMNYFAAVKHYVMNTREIWLLSFVTQSSFGCLPKTIKTAEGYGVAKDVAATTPSLGTSMGLSVCGGTFPAVVAILSATYYNINMDAGFWIQLILIGMIISLGIAGIPGTATVSTVTLLVSMGIPTAAYASLVPMEQLVDPIRTMANVNSALANAIIVDKVVSVTDARDAKKKGKLEAKTETKKAAAKKTAAKKTAKKSS